MLLTTDGLGEDKGPRLEASLLRRREHETPKLAHTKLSAKVPSDADPGSQLGGGCPGRPCERGPARNWHGWDKQRMQPIGHCLAPGPAGEGVVVLSVWIRERRLQVAPATVHR